MNLLLAVTLLAATPFVSDEERIGPLRNPMDLTLVRSADATLLAWQEDTHVKARVGEKTIELGMGTDVRAATDGSDFQIIWVDQNRVAGARWSKPSDVKTLAPLSVVVDPWFGTTASTYRRPAAIVWNGAVFQVFSGYDEVDAAAALKGVVLTTAGFSPHRECFFGLSPISRGCFDRNASRIEWKIRPDNALAGTFNVIQFGYVTTHLPSVVAGNDEFLIVWKSSTAIEGVRVRRDGSTAGFVTVPIAHSLTGKRGPQVAFDGTRYLIVFDVDSDIRGAFVTPGVNLIADPFVIANSTAQEFSPTVAALGPDRFGVAYKINNDQIGTRVVSFTEPPSRRRAAQ